MTDVHISSIARPLLTVRQLADLLQVSTRTIWRMQSAGDLPEPVRISRSVRWRRSDIDYWLAGDAGKTSSILPHKV